MINQSNDIAEMPTTNFFNIKTNKVPHLLITYRKSQHGTNLGAKAMKGLMIQEDTFDCLSAVSSATNYFLSSAGRHDTRTAFCVFSDSSSPMWNWKSSTLPCVHATWVSEGGDRKKKKKKSQQVNWVNYRHFNDSCPRLDIFSLVRTK